MSEHEAPVDGQGAAEPSPSETATSTRVGFRWLRKMLIVWLVFAGAVAWFAYDGFVKYPRRGEAFLEFALKDYLAAAEAERRLTPVGASVQDPAEQLRSLAQAGAATLTNYDKAQLVWLTSLSRVESLDGIAAKNASLGAGQASETVFTDPLARLKALQQSLANKNPPAPLSAYDVPLQHLIWVLCGAILAWLSAKIVAAYMKTYRFNHETLGLTLPSGESFTPDRITDVDKRKWDKFLVFMSVEGIDGELKFDGLKYDHLEHWVLKMEKAWPGYVPEDEDQGEGDADASPEGGSESGGVGDPERAAQEGA